MDRPVFCLSDDAVQHRLRFAEAHQILQALAGRVFSFFTLHVDLWIILHVSDVRSPPGERDR